LPSSRSSTPVKPDFKLIAVCDNYPILPTGFPAIIKKNRDYCNAENQSFLGAFWGRWQAAPKPGYPFQVLGFANANPVGFPLLSHCAAAAQDKARQLPGRGIAFGNSAALTRRSQFGTNCVICHQA
jgi:hypothetical protein